MDDTARRTAETITLEGCKVQGLGIRIVGGHNIILADGEKSDFGIFIKEVLAGRLAKIDGRLRKGDQLLEANGQSLVGVSNSNAMSILKECAATDRIVLRVSRDSKSKSDFKRLSRGSDSQDLPAPPVASSTPLHPPLSRGEDEKHTPLQSYSLATPTASKSDTTTTMTNQRNSSSSELTNITTTDISSHGDEEEGEEEHPQSPSGRGDGIRDGSYSPGLGSMKPDVPVNLSDIALSERPAGLPSLPSGDPPLVVDGYRGDSDDDVPPPPVPSTLPPIETGGEEDDDISEEEEEEEEGDRSPPPTPPTAPMPDDEELIDQKKRFPTRDEVIKTGTSLADTAMYGRQTPEGKSTSSPPPSSPYSPLHHSTVTVPKGVAGLGLQVRGGVKEYSGPHIMIDKILEGSDAAKDGRLQVGDRILSVNGDSFLGITRERALTILTQMKGRLTVKSYTIEYERPVVVSDTNERGSLFESLPHILTSQPLTYDTVFDADTLPVAEATTATGYSTGQGVRPVIPRRYQGKKEQDKTKCDSISKRLSMDPSARVGLAKLELALQFMGHTLTPEQKESIHTQLGVDKNGKVVFSEFVRLARELFAFKMEASNLEMGLSLALMQKESMELPLYLKDKAGSMDALSYPTPSSPTKLSTSHPHISTLPSSHSLPRDTPSLLEKEAELRHHREQLGQRQEERRKMSGGRPSDSYLGTTVSDTLLMREVGPTKPRGGVSSTKHYTGMELSGLNETEVLHKRVGLLEAALREKERELELLQQVAPGSSREAQSLRRLLLHNEENLARKGLQSKQLEETIRHMEAELSDLRRRPAEQHMPTIDLQRRLQTMDCQLRKEQAITRRFQVTTERLMQFMETCHEALVKSPEASKILYHRHGKGEAVQRGDAVTGNPRPPPYLARHAKVTSVTLAQEAHDTILSVQKMLQIKNLPYGWEETYTEEGEKYYMNHETQTTSWVHPVTHVSAVPSSPSSCSSSSSLHSRHSSQSSPHHSLTLQPSPHTQHTPLETA